METVGRSKVGRSAIRVGGWAVLCLGAEFPFHLHAASGIASADATVVAPAAVAVSHPHLHFQSGLGTGQLTVKGSGALNYAVALQTMPDIKAGENDTIKSIAVTNFSSAGTLPDGVQMLSVTANLAQEARRLAGLHTANFAVTVAYD